MIGALLTAALFAGSGPPDTIVQLGTVERDLSGDSLLETLSLTARGRTVDSLEVTFTILSSGRTIYETKWSLTRAVGFDAGRRILSAAEHRARLGEIRRSFFAETQFMSPSEFLTRLRASAPRHVSLVPDAIARDLDQGNRSRAETIWAQMQRADITIFEFSTGGDAVTAIGWSASDQRFYRLLECC